MVLTYSFKHTHEPIKVHWVVPENVHTPTTEGIGNSEGVGGSKTQEIPEEKGIGRSILFPHALRFNTNSSIDLAVQNPFLPPKQTFHVKNSSLNACFLIALYLKYIFFLQKALWKLTNAKNVPCYQSTLCGPKSTGDQPNLLLNRSWKMPSGAQFLSQQ